MKATKSVFSKGYSKNETVKTVTKGSIKKYKNTKNCKKTIDDQWTEKLGNWFFFKYMIKNQS